MGRRFGFECELESGANAVIAELANRGLARTTSLHGYHCGCSDCAHNDVESDGGPLFRGQRDCTVDGEIITSILTHGTENTDRAFSNLADVLARTRAGIGDDAGFHVHVDKRDMDDLDKLRLYRLFMRYQTTDLAELASASLDGVRDYNHPIRGADAFVRPTGNFEHYFAETGMWLYRHQRPYDYLPCNCGSCGDMPGSPALLRNVERRQSEQAEWDRVFGPSADPFWNDNSLVPIDQGKGCWLNTYGASDGTRTFEFRLWNSTRVEWRMRLAVGVSVAMVDAAKAGVNVTKDDPRTLEEVLDPFLSDDTWASIIRQRSFKDAA